MEQNYTFTVENVSRIGEENAKFAAELKEMEIGKGSTSKEIEEKESGYDRGK